MHKGRHVCAMQPQYSQHVARARVFTASATNTAVVFLRVGVVGPVWLCDLQTSNSRMCGKKCLFGAHGPFAEHAL
jgi:hypothetical protein